MSLTSPAQPDKPTVASHAGDTIRSALDIESALRGAPEPLDFVLPGFKRGTVGALVSPGGVGKSFWALAVCAALSGGERANVTGFRLDQGPVVLFSAEEDEPLLAQRVHAQTEVIARANELEPHKRVQMWKHARLYSFFGESPDVMTESCFQELVKLGAHARLIILDTLARFHRLDENSSSDMARLIAQLERLAHLTGASVLFIHHASKLAGMSRQTDLQQAARGSTVLVDHARWVSFMATMSEREAKAVGIDAVNRARYVRWNINKQNYGPALPDVWYRRDSGGALRVVDLQSASTDKSSSHTPFLVESRGQKVSAIDARASHTCGRTRPASRAGLCPQARAQLGSRASALAPSTLPSARGAFNGQW